LNADTARRLVEAGETLGIYVEAHPGYSGRAMYGRTTDGVLVNSHSDLLKLAAHACFALASKGNKDGAVEFIDNLDLRFDDMGAQVIAY